MDEVRYASGRWQVQEGKADEFISRWHGWIAWTSENIPGFRSATLLRSDEDASCSSRCPTGMTRSR